MPDTTPHNGAMTAALPPKRRRGRPSHAVPSELYETRREEILQAARAVFMGCGYDAASLDDIAQAAGISKPSLYYYFPSKAHVFYELARQRLDEHVLLLAAIAAEPDPKKRLIGLMRHQVQQIAADLGFYRYFFEHLPALQDRDIRQNFNNELQKYTAYFYDSVNEAIKAGILPPMNERIATQAIFGATFWIYKWFDAGQFTQEEVLRQFLMMIGVIKPGETF